MSCPLSHGGPYAGEEDASGPRPRPSTPTPQPQALGRGLGLCLVGSELCSSLALVQTS